MRTTIFRGLTTAMLVLSMSGVSSLAVADPIEIAQGGESSGTSKIGPSFICEGARDVLALIICSDNELRRLDVEMVQPYYTLTQAVPTQLQNLRIHAVNFTREVITRCDIPAQGPIDSTIVARSRNCIANEYKKQKSVWQNYVAQTGNRIASEEAQRPVDEHWALHHRLKSAGFLSADDQIDGAFGAKTRQAISAAQQRFGLPVDGFMSNQVAAKLVDLAPSVTSNIDLPINKLDALLAPLTAPSQSASSVTAQPPALSVPQSLLPPCPPIGSYRNNCFGTYTFANGNKYVGEFRDDARNGQGSLTFPNGSKYIGEFRNGVRNGLGIYTYSNSSQYIGEFRDDARDGQGTETYPDGKRYTGDFKQGRRNGLGVLVLSNGEKHVGEFREDLLNGVGHVYSLAGTLIEAGVFKDGYIAKSNMRVATEPEKKPSEKQRPNEAPVKAVTLIAVYVAYNKGERRQKIDIHTEIDCSISAMFGGAGLPIAPCVAKEGNLEIDLNIQKLERDQRIKMMSRCKNIFQSCSGTIVGTTGTSDGKMIINVSELKLD